jgi:hypothetical protein
MMDDDNKTPDSKTTFPESQPERPAAEPGAGDSASTDEVPAKLSESEHLDRLQKEAGECLKADCKRVWLELLPEMESFWARQAEYERANPPCSRSIEESFPDNLDSQNTPPSDQDAAQVSEPEESGAPIAVSRTSSAPNKARKASPIVSAAPRKNTSSQKSAPYIAAGIDAATRLLELLADEDPEADGREAQAQEADLETEEGHCHD